MTNVEQILKNRGFNMDSIMRGLAAARKLRLTLCIAGNGDWACEPRDSYLDGQICRICRNFSREELAAHILECSNAVLEQQNFWIEA